MQRDPGIRDGAHDEVHNVDESGAQGCEFTFCLAVQTWGAFWLLLDSGTSVAASRLPSLSGSHIPLAALVSYILLIFSPLLLP